MSEIYKRLGDLIAVRGITVGVWAVGAVKRTAREGYPEGDGGMGEVKTDCERGINQMEKGIEGGQIAMSRIYKRRGEEKTDCASGAFKGQWVWGQA